jgi:hypothetical protein
LATLTERDVERLLNTSRTGFGADRKVAVALATAAFLLLISGPFVFRPWGTEPSSAPDVASFLSGAAMANDFVSFWTGAELVRQGAGSALYDMDLQHSFQVELRSGRFVGERLVNRLDPFHTPPPMALLMLPLTLLPLPWAYALWTALSLAGLVVAVAMPLRGSRVAWTPVVLMLATGGVADILFWGQVDALFLLAFSLALLAFAKERRVLGGVLLGVLWLKPQYALVFPLVFLLKRRWWELAGMLGTGAALVLVSVLMIGVDGAANYLQVLRTIGTYNPPPESFIFPEIMVNWRAVLVNLWPDLSESAGSLLVTGLGGATLLASLLVWRGGWEPGSRRFALQMLVATTAALVASPHSHLHGIALLLPPLALALARSGDDGVPRELWHVVLPVGSLLSWAGWLYDPLRWLLAPYLLIAAALLVYRLRTMPCAQVAS